jgi:hypothetical protein
MWKKLEWIYEYKVFIVFLSSKKIVTLSDKVGSYNHICNSTFHCMWKTYKHWEMEFMTNENNNRMNVYMHHWLALLWKNCVETIMFLNKTKKMGSQSKF